MIRRQETRAGAILIGLIGALIVVGLLAGGIALLLDSALLQSMEISASSDAFCAAETGIALGKAYIATNTSWYQTVPYTIAGIIGQATFSAVVESTNYPDVLITSSGQKQSSRWTSIWAGTTATMRALAAYRDTGASPAVPRFRNYMSSGQLSSEQNASSTVNPPQWIRIVASPKTNEFLMVVQDSLRWVRSQPYTNGTWGTNTLLNGAGASFAAADRGFDVAYENLSGRGMVVYSVGTTNPQYRTWNGTNWSAPGLIQMGALFPISWVRLVPKPASNEIMMLARWRKSTNPRGNYTSAIVWNGSTWANLQALEVLCGSSIDCESMDAAYSTNNTALVLYNGTDVNINNPKYRTWSAAGWSTQCVMATVGAIPQWIRTEFNPNGTNAYAAFLGANSKLNGAHWNGSAWGTYTNFANVTIESAAYRDFDIAWCSQSNMIMVTYCQLNVDGHLYMTQVVGDSPAYGSLPAGTTDGRWSVLKPDPNSADFVYMAIDDGSDVNAYRWNGSEWSLISELETASDSSYDSIGFAFRRDQ